MSLSSRGRRGRGPLHASFLRVQGWWRPRDLLFSVLAQARLFAPLDFAGRSALRYLLGDFRLLRRETAEPPVRKAHGGLLFTVL
jgi:hypothetical protein